MEVLYWLVTVEKTRTGKRRSMRIATPSALIAGHMACELVGGPRADLYHVVRCVPGDMVGAISATVNISAPATNTEKGE